MKEKNPKGNWQNGSNSSSSSSSSSCISSSSNVLLLLNMEVWWIVEMWSWIIGIKDHSMYFLTWRSKCVGVCYMPTSTMGCLTLEQFWQDCFSVNWVWLSITWCLLIVQQDFSTQYTFISCTAEKHFSRLYARYLYHVNCLQSLALVLVQLELNKNDMDLHLIDAEFSC